MVCAFLARFMYVPLTFSQMYHTFKRPHPLHKRSSYWDSPLSVAGVHALGSRPAQSLIGLYCLTAVHMPVFLRTLELHTDFTMIGPRHALPLLLDACWATSHAATRRMITRLSIMPASSHSNIHAVLRQDVSIRRQWRRRVHCFDRHHSYFVHMAGLR